MNLGQAVMSIRTKQLCINSGNILFLIEHVFVFYLFPFFYSKVYRGIESVCVCVCVCVCVLLAD